MLDILRGLQSPQLCLPPASMAGNGRKVARHLRRYQNFRQSVTVLASFSKTKRQPNYMTKYETTYFHRRPFSRREAYSPVQAQTPWKRTPATLLYRDASCRKVLILGGPLNHSPQEARP